MEVEIRPLVEADLPEADRIFRSAFGTWLKLPDPMAFGGDTDFVGTRFRSRAVASIGAFSDGTLVGSNFLTRWGSFGFFGPLTVRPDCWDQGIAQRLLAATNSQFAAWGCSQLALFTFPQSTKHVSLYHKFGFWPGHLTVMMEKPSDPTVGAKYRRLTLLESAERDVFLRDAAQLTGSVLPGLDLRQEILSLEEQRLGEVLLIDREEGLAGFAVCHIGPATEAGSGDLYVKFGAVRPGAFAARRFADLLTACQSLAASLAVPRVLAAVNAESRAAYRVFVDQGFRSLMHGVVMKSPPGSALTGSDDFVIADLR